jgi:uncharacterized NAD(P)/FAD-binding protein YdhS
MQSYQTYDVVVIGGGTSGSSVVIQLIRAAAKEAFKLKICIIEPRELLCAGIAYSTTKPYHLLNVPAVSMGIEEADPSAFYRWIGEQNLPFSPDDFVPRFLYQRFVMDTLNSVITQHSDLISFSSLTDSVNSVDKYDSSFYLIATETGFRYLSKTIVIAVGNSPKGTEHKFDKKEPDTGKLVNPWNSDRISSLARTSSHIAIIGTGLTAVDTVLSFESEGFTGQYTLISRKGLLPHKHAHQHANQASSSELPFSQLPYSIPKKLINELTSKQSLRTKLKLLRREIRGKEWRVVLDELRGYIPIIWQSLSLPERTLFLSKLRAYWEVHRHRIPPSSHQTITNLQIQGRLKILRKAIKDCDLVENSQGIWINVANTSRHLGPFSACIDCRGLWSNLHTCDSPVLRSMAEQGLLFFDSLGLGILSDNLGLLTNQSGQTIPKIYTLGALCRGAIFESTSVRTIRSQAATVSQSILRQLQCDNVEPNNHCKSVQNEEVRGSDFNSRLTL